MGVDLYLDALDVYTCKAKPHVLLLHDRSQDYRSAYEEMFKKRQELREGVEQEASNLGIPL